MYIQYAYLESSIFLRISDAAIFSPDGSMQGPEQLEDPARPVTPDYPLQGTDLAIDLEQLEDPARPTTPDYPLQGSDLAIDLEQLEDPARPMTPEE